MRQCCEPPREEDYKFDWYPPSFVNCKIITSDPRLTLRLLSLELSNPLYSNTAPATLSTLKKNMSNRSDIDTYPAPSAKLASMENKRKAPCGGHDNHTRGPTCLPGVRRLPNLAPKPAAINSESYHIFSGDSQRKRTRVDKDTQGSPQLLQQIYATMEPMSLTNNAGSHMGNDILDLEFNGPVGESNIPSMMHDTQCSENLTLVIPFDPLPNSHNLSQGEISWPYALANIPNRYIPQLPSMMLQGPPISDPLGVAPALRICAGCDARLTGFRNFIYTEVEDTALKTRLLGEYFALRDNWHSCHTRGFWGLEARLDFDWVMASHGEWQWMTKEGCGFLFLFFSFLVRVQGLGMGLCVFGCAQISLVCAYMPRLLAENSFSVDNLRDWEREQPRRLSGPFPLSWTILPTRFLSCSHVLHTSIWIYICRLLLIHISFKTR